MNRDDPDAVDDRLAPCEIPAPPEPADLSGNGNLIDEPSPQEVFDQIDEWEHEFEVAEQCLDRQTQRERECQGLELPFDPSPFAPVPFWKWEQRKPSPYVVSRLLRANSIALMFGDAGSGKTCVALDVACRVAIGARLWGEYATVQGPVVYCTSEGIDGIGKRVLSWLSAHADQRGKLMDSLHLLDLVPDFSDDENLEEFVNAVRRTCPDLKLLVVDTFIAALGRADENAAGDVQRVLDGSRRIQRELGCGTLFVHHKNKTGGIRGSTALLAGVDLAFRVSRLPGHAVRGCVLQFGGDDCKVKDFEPPTDLTLAFEQVDLGVDELDPDKSRMTALRVADVTSVGSNRPPRDPAGFDGKPVDPRKMAVLEFLAQHGDRGASRAELQVAVAGAIGDELPEHKARTLLKGLRGRGYVRMIGTTWQARYFIADAAVAWLREQGELTTP